MTLSYIRRSTQWRVFRVKIALSNKVLLVLTLAGGVGLAQTPDWNALGKTWWSHVQFLADDSLEGRDTGSRGFEKAADYMAEQFRAAGLEPAGVNGYRQPMDFQVVKIDESRCSLDLLREGKTEPVKLGDDATLGVSSHAAENVEAGLVFVGYGLTVPESHYDDLAGQDLKGKVVVLVTGGPRDMPGPVKAHYQSGEERWKALAKAGVIGTITIQSPKTAEVPWSRIAASRFQPRMDLSNPGKGRRLPCRLALHSILRVRRCSLLAAAIASRKFLLPLRRISPCPIFRWRSRSTRAWV